MSSLPKMSNVQKYILKIRNHSFPTVFASLVLNYQVAHEYCLKFMRHTVMTLSSEVLIQNITEIAA